MRDRNFKPLYILSDFSPRDGPLSIYDICGRCNILTLCNYRAQAYPDKSVRLPESNISISIYQKIALKREHQWKAGRSIEGDGVWCLPEERTFYSAWYLYLDYESHTSVPNILW